MIKHYGLTDEENELITACVVLPMVLSVVEKNKFAMQSEKLSLKKLYLMAADVLIYRIKEEIAHVKKEAWKSKLIVIKGKPDEPLSYAYACRGLSNSLEMPKETAQREIGAALERFIRDLGQCLVSR
ncbi:hypothetical protein ACFFK0_17815 [Paenibacillus chartarius]|uniref:Uncharacterized protein n=1 Tax=Paenibacillus chartarius TaxID=747481 RepID=A0ABV6DNR9_9BACL